MKKRWLLLFYMMIPLCLLSAHPHISVNAYTHYYFDDQGLMGFYVQWAYDPMFSSQIIYECDANMDNAFSQKEIEEVESYFFSRLASDGYYMRLKVAGEKIPVPTAQNFSAEIDKEDEVVFFTFYIPLAVPNSGKETQLYVEFSDPTNYTAFICPQRSLSIQGTEQNIKHVKINRLGSISFTY